MSKTYTCASSSDSSDGEDGWSAPTYPSGRPSWLTDNPYSNLAEALCCAPAAERERFFAWMDEKAAARASSAPTEETGRPRAGSRDTNFAQTAAARAGAIEGIFGYARTT